MMYDPRTQEYILEGGIRVGIVQLHNLFPKLTKDRMGAEMADEFVIKDSGKREVFSGGMVRDTTEGKIDWWRVRIGPMLRRWAVHLTKGNDKYPDVKPMTPNWTLAEGEAEMLRFKASADRHFAQWFNGDTDEDHAAAVIFNINGYEYVKEKGVKSESPNN
jgi:hypothetical protein